MLFIAYKSTVCSHVDVMTFDGKKEYDDMKKMIKQSQTLELVSCGRTIHVDKGGGLYK